MFEITVFLFSDGKIFDFKNNFLKSKSKNIPTVTTTESKNIKDRKTLIFLDIIPNLVYFFKSKFVNMRN